MIFSSVPVICALEGWRDEWNKILDLFFTLGQMNPASQSAQQTCRNRMTNRDDEKCELRLFRVGFSDF